MAAAQTIRRLLASSKNRSEAGWLACIKAPQRAAPEEHHGTHCERSVNSLREHCETRCAGYMAVRALALPMTPLPERCDQQCAIEALVIELFRFLKNSKF